MTAEAIALARDQRDDETTYWEGHEDDFRLRHNDCGNTCVMNN
jgi:hypothetical protein